MKNYVKKLDQANRIVPLLAVLRHSDPKMEFLHGYQQTISADEMRADFYDLVNDANTKRLVKLTSDEMSLLFIGA